MMLTLTKPNHLSVAAFKTKALAEARRRIWLFPKLAAEEELDIYCLEHYQVPLKLLCIKLLAHMKFTCNGTGDFTVSFINPKYDRLAMLITYGNGKLFGSKILKNAFDL